MTQQEKLSCKYVCQDCGCEISHFTDMRIAPPRKCFMCKGRELKKEALK